MGYEEIMLAIKANREDETKAKLARHRAINEQVSDITERQSIYDKLYSAEKGVEIVKSDIFKESVKESYLVEALTILVDNCLEPYIIKEEYNQKLARQLVSNFVKQEGADHLLNKMKRTSYIMSEIAYTCESAIIATLENSKDNDQLKLTKQPKNEFYDKLQHVDVDETVKEITNRVKESTSDFIEQNIEDKQKISEVLQKTNEKVDKEKEKIANIPDASDKTKENSQKIQESYISKGQRELIDIRENRSKNIFECMVYNLSKTALVNEAAKNVFVKDSRLDMDKLVEHCEVMYTFLTTMDSCKLINVNEEYIMNMLNDLKC